MPSKTKLPSWVARRPTTGPTRSSSPGSNLKDEAVKNSARGPLLELPSVTRICFGTKTNTQNVYSNINYIYTLHFENTAPKLPSK